MNKLTIRIHLLTLSIIVIHNMINKDKPDKFSH